MALLWKMICNLGDPMSLRHPVICFSRKRHTQIERGREGGREREKERERERETEREREREIPVS